MIRRSPESPMRGRAPRPGTFALVLALVLAVPSAGAIEPVAPDAEELMAAAPDGPEKKERGKGLARRPDERRPDVQFSTTLFGRPLTLGGQWEIVHQSRQNFDLNSAVARNRSRLDQELKLEAFHRTTETASVFVQAVGLSEIDTHRSTGHRTSEHWLERGQMWIYAEDLAGAPVALQIGRIGLIEPRTWWWDDNLDAVRVYVGRRDWLIETGVGRELARVSSADRHIDPEQDGVLRWFGRAAWEWRRRHTLEGYWLATRDTSERPVPGAVFDEDRADASDADLRWFGLRALGDERPGQGRRFGYWIDAAWVRGRETLGRLRDVSPGLARFDRVTEQKVRGQAIDLGAMWTFGTSMRPTATLAYARGTGDSTPGDGVDRAYRQTGLQENKGRYRGVNRFRYYGELFRPELSNLSIATAAFGFRFRERSSLELVFHDYRQVHPSTVIRDSRLNAAPNGVDRHLGREFDVILGVRESPRVEFAAVLGAFRAGSAFGAREGERAYYVEFEVTFVF